MIGISWDNIVSLADRLKEVSIPIDEFTNPKYYPPDSDPVEDVANYFFFMVSIDHRTRVKNTIFEGYVDGEYYYGTDLLYRLGIAKYNDDPKFFSPSNMVNIDEKTVIEWLSIREPKTCVIRDPSIRAILLSDAANKLLKFYNGSTLRLISESGGYLYTRDCSGFIDRLKIFKAYNDPVEKKSFLLAKFLERRGMLRIKDKHNARLPIDNHLTRIAIRLGIVEPNKKILNYFLPDGEDVDAEIDAIIRLTIRHAYRLLCEAAKTDPFLLDDLLWLLGRKICKYEKPLCDRNIPITDGLTGCPFRGVCSAHRDPDRRFLVEHSFIDTWWY